MLRKTISKTITLPDNRTIVIETGKLATQADGSVLVCMNNTMLLATVVSKENPKDDGDFLLLSVDYQEKFAASGKIPGGFSKREGRLGDHEILVARLVDRAIRPLFPKGYRSEIQVNISLLSADDDMLPDALATLSASLALMVSPLPFLEPISGVRIIRIGKDFIINPSVHMIAKADLNLIVAATQEYVVMVEGEMKEVQEADLIDAISYAHTVIKAHCQVQKELMLAVGVSKELDFGPVEQVDYPDDLKETIYRDIYAIAKQGIPSKALRKKALQALRAHYDEQLTYDVQGNEVPKSHKHSFFTELEVKAIRDMVLNEHIRLDGRALKDIRTIASEVDYLPSTHGSALFTRGETQSLTTVTLGSKFDEQIIDRVMEDGYSRFMLHYNFPSFSTGEVKPSRGPSRREIGHGNLAMRALKAVLPPDNENLYTIRVVADTLESNGSSSMATVCASSLALMDAGIPIRTHVSGIAMGLIADAQGHVAILSDILGDEDHLGDMDFKVAGTKQGMTACQMDIKIPGISYEILSKALHQAKQGRLYILEKMNQTIACPRPTCKPHAPKIVCLEIEKEMIGPLIGPGGKVIQEIQKETETNIDIVEVNTKGIVKIFANNKQMLQKALDWIESIVAKPVVGTIYKGKVKSILNYGAFVEFMPGKDGLLHVSEVSQERIEDLCTVLKVGEELSVKLIGIDAKTGKFRLSHKDLCASSDSSIKIVGKS